MLRAAAAAPSAAAAAAPTAPPPSLTGTVMSAPGTAIGVGVAVSDYDSPIMGIGYLGGAILTLATGILVIRSKD